MARRAGFGTNMMALWNATRWFQEAFGAHAKRGGGGGTGTAEALVLPPLPGGYCLGRLARLAEEQGVLAEGSTFYSILAEGGGRVWW